VFNFKYNDMEGKIQFPYISEDAADSPDEWKTQLSFTETSTGKSAGDKKPVRTAADQTVIPAFRKIFAQWAQEFKTLPSE
jgi:hypothetical protein